MNKLISLFLAILLGISTVHAFAQAYRKLEGTYSVTSATLIDPPVSEKKDRVVMIIKGSAARDIYEAMPGKPRKSECDPGILLKTSGNLTCAKESTLYTCNVAVLLKSGETASALVC